ncbi:MAG: ATP-dependent DNA helicase RecQ [Verrucomicrobiales bacterium]|jgi:ATP-dependent DNA helicase RecQ
MNQKDDISAPEKADAKDPLVALERYFGFRKFLDGQNSVVGAVLGGRDVLAIMPTGGGKSLCYQLPAMVMDGVTVVVSPLIALMKDQVDALQRKGIAATMINSSLGMAEQRERLNELRAGKLKLVYIAPERFRSSSFLEALQAVPVAFFAIDEAHCLSQWGHDFRPDYLRLGEALDQLGRPQTAAFTATATPEVRRDILRSLGLRDPFECVSGFERPNLSLRVTPVEKVRQKFVRLKKIIEKHRTGIIYCATRRKVEEVAETLFDWNVPCVAYHGGMKDEERERAQNLFIERRRDVAVATNAFGMGIDRADVRFVAHFEMPGSIEAYYQEAGRAGRDGEPAVCELLFNHADSRTQEFFIEGNNPSRACITDVYRTLKKLTNSRHELIMPLKELAGAVPSLSNEMALSSAISTLVRGRYVARFDVPRGRIKGTRLLRPEIDPDALELNWEAIEEKERRDHEKLRAILDLCYSNSCRQQWILRYFGEQDAGICGTCDVCLKGVSADFRDATEWELVNVRKLLSGVGRASIRLPGGRWEGRFGQGKIVQMLVGSRSQEVLSARLDELTTYGILKDLGAAYVTELFRELLQAGYIAKSGGQYPLIVLTERGALVMFGKESTCRLNWPGSATGRESDASSVKELPAGLSLDGDEMGFDQELFNKLTILRANLARQEGVPAYSIFQTATLEFFTRLKPQSADAGMRIRGVGPVNGEKYLAHFIECIQKHDSSSVE